MGRRIAQSAFLYKRYGEGEAYRIFEGVICQLLLKRPDLGANYEWLPAELFYHQWCRWLSQMLVQISSFEEQATVNQFVEHVKEVLEPSFNNFLWAQQSKLGNKIYVKPKDQGEQRLLSFFDDTLIAGSVITKTVHKLKGSSVEGLMLVGSYHVDDHWSDVKEWLHPPNQTTGLCEEPRRIAYVAMTRPRKLLVVAIPRECGSRLINHPDWRRGNFECVQFEEILSDSFI